VDLDAPVFQGPEAGRIDFVGANAPNYVCIQYERHEQFGVECEASQFLEDLWSGGFFNPKRKHSTIGPPSPGQFESQIAARFAT